MESDLNILCLLQLLHHLLQLGMTGRQPVLGVRRPTRAGTGRLHRSWPPAALHQLPLLGFGLQFTFGLRLKYNEYSYSYFGNVLE